MPGFRGVDLGFPPGDGPLFGAGVQGDLGAVAGDAEVGVLDVDGDDLPGVGGSNPQSLAGDHDDAVAGDLALDADRTGSWGGQRARGDPGAAQRAAAGGRDRAGQGLGQDTVADDVDQVPVEPERDPAAGQFGADLDPVTGQIGDPVCVGGPVDLDRCAARQRARLGRGGRPGWWPAGGPAGLAPRSFGVARSSASRQDGTVLTSWPPMSTCTVNSSAYTCASCPARVAPILIRCTAASRRLTGSPGAGSRTIR